MSVRKVVALRYPKSADAPYISAKGKGALADRILELARENDIPVVKNDKMVDVLSVQNAGDLIPETTYSVIAEIFAFIRSFEENHEH